jgi:hypothetical protein
MDCDLASDMGVVTGREAGLSAAAMGAIVLFLAIRPAGNCMFGRLTISAVRFLVSNRPHDSFAARCSAGIGKLSHGIGFRCGGAPHLCPMYRK